MLELKDLTKRFERASDPIERFVRRVAGRPQPPSVHALDRVSLSVTEGQVMGLVGESGCGKSTLGRIVAGVMSASDGAIVWNGKSVAAMDGAERKRFNLTVQLIFQDPFASLNPRMRVREIVGEAPLAHGLIERKQYDDYVDEMLLQVGLDPSYKLRYPHQFSGGQRARVGIARALAVKPRFLVCDESVAALDVSIQAQVINLFMDLRERLRLTYLFISHDLGVVEHLSDKVAIMYLGRIVEMAPTGDLYAEPNHPYTRALLAEVPRISLEPQNFHPIKGEIPSPLNPPPGCHFHPRCPHAVARCRVERPDLKQIAPQRWSACHLNDSV